MRVKTNLIDVVYDGGTILDVLEDHNHAPKSQCKDGFCGACRTKIKSVKVKYLTDPIGYKSDDEILPCICMPVSSVELEVS